MTGIDPAFGNWLAGFIDGEGSFIIRPAGRRADSYAVEFKLSLRDDDLSIVNEIRARTGLGSIVRKDQPASAPETHRPVVMWEVRRKDELARLVRILDECPLRAKKRRDFEVWKRAVRVLATTHSGIGMSSWARYSANWRLRQLKKDLQAVREYRAPGTASVVESVEAAQLELGSEL